GALGSPRGGGLDSIAQGGYRERPAAVSERVRRQSDGQPHLDGAHPQTAIIPTATVSFSGLWPAGPRHLLGAQLTDWFRAGPGYQSRAAEGPAGWVSGLHRNTKSSENFR